MGSAKDLRRQRSNSSDLKWNIRHPCSWPRFMPGSLHSAYLTLALISSLHLFQLQPQFKLLSAKLSSSPGFLALNSAPGTLQDAQHKPKVFQVQSCLLSLLSRLVWTPWCSDTCFLPLPEPEPSSRTGSLVEKCFGSIISFNL